MSRSSLPFGAGLCFFLLFVVFLTVIFSPLHGAETAETEKNVLNGVKVNKGIPRIFAQNKLKSTCGGEVPSQTSFLGPADEPYKLFGTYYSLRGNLTATLMLNNKGPEPILATPTFYSLSGTRLTLAPISVPAASYSDVDLRQLLANAAEEFREGSLKVSYDGGSLQLGAQVKLVDEQRKLIWAEQLVYASKFTSNRLENVWWLPPGQSTTRLVISNTTYSPLTVTITVDGVAPQHDSPAVIQLNPSQTRVLDIMRDIVGHENGTLQSRGGISISHSGNPGALLAKMMVAQPNRGYSATMGFIDPESTASQKWHGNGLRLRHLNGSQLNAGLVARNTTDYVSRIWGKILYTLPNGEVSQVNIPFARISPHSTKLINLQSLIDGEGVPDTIEYTGIELEYDSPKGSIVTSVMSVSADSEHVFQVPMFDPQKMPSSAGGFPWKADGDYTTIVYIKNETDLPKKYTASLIFEGGGYSVGVRDLKPGQTAAVDFKQLRDDQVPDSMGRILPSSLQRGQIAWSMFGPDNKTLSGRSEQISLSGGTANTYACHNCCPNSTVAWWMEPGSSSTLVSGTSQFLPVQRDQNCSGTVFEPYTGFPVDNWGSLNTSVAEVANGLATGMSVGSTNIFADWVRIIYVEPNCGMIPEPIYAESPLEVLDVTITKADGSQLPSPFRLGKTGTVTSGTPISRKQSLKATVTPVAEAANVTIEVSSKITLSNVQRNGGVITFDVVGNTESTNSGDSVILAKRAGVTLTSVPVSVVIPSKIATPHDTMGTYVAANRVLDATTSPSIHGLPSGKVSLQTIYVRYLTITVKDQFNGLIGDIYAGAVVTETIGAANVTINQPLTSASTYSDPVGLGIQHSIVDATSTAAANWPTQPLQPMVSASATQNIPVQVDGFILVPAISARTWTTTAPNTLTISWPN